MVLCVNKGSEIKTYNYTAGVLRELVIVAEIGTVV